MTNVSVANGMAGADSELDIIQEYISEDTSRGRRHNKLPGPPPPPPDSDSDCSKPTCTSRNGLVLVPRGTSSEPFRAYNQVQGSGSHTMRSNRESIHRTGRGATNVAAMTGPRPMRLPACPDTEPLEHLLNKPELVVIEQPKERGMRFRYECEGRSAGSILGAASNDTSKTLPTIELQGPINEIRNVKVTVSLVTKDFPYRPHPHCLVGKDCSDGICVVRFNPHTNRRHSFCNLGIQCVRRKELEVSLKKRREQKIDPFNTGHSKSIEDMDMNVVRLCFQCELETDDGKQIHLSPIVSNPIFDKKATTTSELKITRLNVVKGPCTGKTEIFMLCDKVQKDDIEIIFNHGSWEAKAEFAQTDVHRQIAIVFKSPPYQDQDLMEEVEVNVLLRRLSDRMDSEPVKFIYTPPNPDPYWVTRKRKIKTDFKPADTCNFREPTAFDTFPFPMENPVATAATSQSPPRPTSGMFEPLHYQVDDLRLDETFGSLDPETMNLLYMDMLQDGHTGGLGLGHQDDHVDPLSFPMSDQTPGNPLAHYPDINLNIGQLLANSLLSSASAVLDPLLQHGFNDHGIGVAGEIEGPGIAQVKIEREGDV